MPLELPPNIKEEVAFANGITHPSLGLRVAEHLGIVPIDAEIKEFKDTEIYVRYCENIRDKRFIAFETHAAINSYSLPHSLHRQIHMVDAAIGSAVREVIAVSPYASGQRQDREAREREAVSANLNMRLLKVAGVNHFITVDMHDERSLYEFRQPGYRQNNLTAQDLLVERLRALGADNAAKFALVSPDEGHSKQLRKNANQLGIPLVGMVKERDPDDSTLVHHHGSMEYVEGKTAVIMDDQISSAGTIYSAAIACKQFGAEAVVIAATHGLFTGPYLQRLRSNRIDHILITDTLPLDHAKQKLGSKLEVVSVSGLIASALQKILTGGSVSSLEGGNARA